jgi:hypothetical protein
VELHECFDSVSPYLDRSTVLGFIQMRIQLYVSFISAINASIKLNTKQFKSNESRGDLERVHQTLKKI